MILLAFPVYFDLVMVLWFFSLNFSFSIFFSISYLAISSISSSMCKNFSSLFTLLLVSLIGI